MAHLEIKTPFLKWLSTVLAAFPGVPIFFIISGFLISASYERNPNFKQYVRNRFLRIYPALFISFIVSILIILAFKKISLLYLREFITWIFCQVTFFQFYNPSFLRTFGVGVINGALWTISVEIQFYLLIPIIYFYINKCRTKKTTFFGVLFLIFTLLSFLISAWLPRPDEHVNTQDTYFSFLVLHKLLFVTIIPYLYCFLIGILFRLYLDVIYKYVSEKFLFYFVSYFVVYVVLRSYITFEVTNPLAMILLGFSVISFAYSFTDWSSLLKENDISYGIYIYHMLVVNVFVAWGFLDSILALSVTLVVTLILAMVSWVAIERPALRFKSNPMRDLNVNDLPQESMLARQV